MNGKILLEAHEIINGEREKDYGAPGPCLERVAAMWSAYLETPLTGHDVCLLLALLKIARQAQSRKADNLVDAAGYIGLAGDLGGF